MTHYTAIYLQHGGPDGPFVTESVPFRFKPMLNTVGLQPGPFASHWQVNHGGKWRRIMCASSAPHAYVVIARQRVPVSFEVQS